MATPSSPAILCRFGRGEQIEDPRHLEALVAYQRAARTHRAQDRLHHAAPSAKPLFLRAAEREVHLGVLNRGLLDLLDSHGAVALEAAIVAALAKNAPHLGAVRHFIDTQAQARGQAPPIAVTLPDDPRWRALTVRPHPLSDYQHLTSHQCAPPAQPPSAEWAYRAIAKLGGWMNTQRTGRPGWQTIWYGMFRLAERVDAHVLALDLCKKI